MKWPQLSKIQTISEKVSGDGKTKDPGRWRDLTAYWILGLCNNYGYVVMLSAAHDIISRLNPDDGNHESLGERQCKVMSTGVILLADILPSFVIKVISPFLPFFINVRIFMACFTQCAGFLLVAFAETEWMAISGVALTSFSSGLGETSFLSYSSKFHKNVISTWASGTGGAGIFGSFSYAALIGLGVSPVTTMLIMLSVPLLEGAAFWMLLRKISTIPKRDSDPQFKTSPEDQESGVITNQSSTLTLGEKFRYIPSLLQFMHGAIGISLFIRVLHQSRTGSYLSHFFELINFKNIWLDHEGQYRWLQVDYQIGVFISRSSVNLVKINKLWFLSLFQFINVAIILTEVITYFSPSIWIIFVLVLWEGLLGGGAYVNTFYKMSKDIADDERRKFALGIITVSDTVGIFLAGIAAIPAHNALCKLPMPIRN